MKRKSIDSKTDIDLHDTLSKKYKTDTSMDKNRKYIVTIQKYCKQYIQSKNKKEYKLCNVTTFIGLNLSEIPLQYLIISRKYFFDIRELYNIKIDNIKSLSNPYTKKLFDNYNINYISYIFKKYKRELEEYRSQNVYNEKETFSTLIAKVSELAGRHEVYFNVNNFVSFTVYELDELIQSLYANKLTRRFIDHYTDIDYIDCNQNTYRQKQIFMLNKIYEIISFSDKHRTTRCLLVDQLIEEIFNDIEIEE